MFISAKRFGVFGVNVVLVCLGTSFAGIHLCLCGCSKAFVVGRMYVFVTAIGEVSQAFTIKDSICEGGLGCAFE